MFLTDIPVELSYRYVLSSRIVLYTAVKSLPMESLFSFNHVETSNILLLTEVFKLSIF